MGLSYSFIHYVILTWHHSTKLKSFANINRKVEDHKVVLAERENALEDVQKQLVENGGGMV